CNEKAAVGRFPFDEGSEERLLRPSPQLSRLSPLPILLLHDPHQREIAGVAALVDLAGAYRTLHRALRFVAMHAVGEAALPVVIAELAEQRRDITRRHGPEAVFAHARRVDQFAAGGQVVQRGGGGGVPTCAAARGDLADADVLVWQEQARDRRLAHA